MDERQTRIYPVIRVETATQALAQAKIAYDYPVDGVFLIDHDADHDRLARCIAAVRERFGIALEWEVKRIGDWTEDELR